MCATSKDPSCHFVGHFTLKSSINTVFYNHLRYASSIVRFAMYLGGFHGICNLGVGFFFSNSLCCETTHSATYIRIRKEVAKWVVPQNIGRCSNVLRNGWFHNTFEHLPMCSETTHSATPRFVCKLRNGWFRNSFHTEILFFLKKNYLFDFCCSWQTHG